MMGEEEKKGNEAHVAYKESKEIEDKLAFKGFKALRDKREHEDNEASEGESESTVKEASADHEACVAIQAPKVFREFQGHRVAMDMTEMMGVMGRMVAMDMMEMMGVMGSMGVTGKMGASDLQGQSVLLDPKAQLGEMVVMAGKGPLDRVGGIVDRGRNLALLRIMISVVVLAIEKDHHGDTLIATTASILLLGQYLGISKLSSSEDESRSLADTLQTHWTLIVHKGRSGMSQRPHSYTSSLKL